MSQGPSTFGTIITSSLWPISVTIWVMSSSTQGEASSLTRVHSWVSPRSISLPTLISPARAASLRSTGTASSRLPRRMSTLGARSGALATIFSFEKSRKWIILEGLNGTSRTGSGASTARGLKKSRGLRIGPGTLMIASRGRPTRPLLPRSQRGLARAPVGHAGNARGAARGAGPPRVHGGHLRVGGERAAGGADARGELRRRLRVGGPAGRAHSSPSRAPGQPLCGHRLPAGARAADELGRHRPVARHRARAGAAPALVGGGRRARRGGLGGGIAYPLAPAPESDPRRCRPGPGARGLPNHPRGPGRPALPDARVPVRRPRRAGGGGRSGSGLYGGGHAARDVPQGHPAHLAPGGHLP